MSEFSRIVGYMVSIQKSIIVLHTSHRQLENKILKIPFSIASKENIHSNKFDKLDL